METSNSSPNSGRVSTSSDSTSRLEKETMKSGDKEISHESLVEERENNHHQGQQSSVSPEKGEARARDNEAKYKAYYNAEKATAWLQEGNHLLDESPPTSRVVEGFRPNLSGMDISSRTLQKIIAERNHQQQLPPTSEARERTTSATSSSVGARKPPTNLPSLPGAFSNAPGGQSVRNERLHYSSAFKQNDEVTAVDGEDLEKPSLDDLENQVASSASLDDTKQNKDTDKTVSRADSADLKSMDFPPPVPFSKSDSSRSSKNSNSLSKSLIEATLVESDSNINTSPPPPPRGSNLTDPELCIEAKPIDSEEIVRNFFLHSKKGYSILAALVIFIVGGVLGIVFGMGLHEEEEPVVVPSVMPTFAPTQAPTVEFTVDLLPDYTREAIQEDPSSPQSLAFDWLTSDPDLQAILPERKMQRFALATLYYSTVGDSWEDSTSWMSYDVHECEWFSGHEHEACNQQDQYIDLTLPNNNLRGEIPREIFLLTSLQRIELEGNTRLGGSISSELGQLSDMKELLIYETSLGGSIPTDVGMLHHLIELIMYNNRMTGTLPSEVGSSSRLTTIAVSNNYLNGTLPSELGNLSYLFSLNVQSNRLIGSIPSEIGSLGHLIQLLASGNRITGALPTEVGLLSRVVEFEFKDNRLHHAIPTEIFQLEDMQVLLLGNNGLDSTIPSEVGLATSLEHLCINGNNLVQAMPSEIGLLTRLSELDIEANILTGHIPTTLGLLTFLDRLSLGRNNFTTGPIPSELGELPLLVELTMNGLNRNGTIPTQMFQLTDLVSLDLCNNALTGTIPADFALLSGLEKLCLRDNSFNGTVPSALDFITDLRAD